MSKEDFKQFELSTFAGYLSADAEIKYFESGKNKVTFSIPLSLTKDSNHGLESFLAFVHFLYKSSYSASS